MITRCARIYVPDILIDALATAHRNAHAVTYKLFAGASLFPLSLIMTVLIVSTPYVLVVYHHGQSASGGHYTLDVLHPNRGGESKAREGWIRIDDELVSDLRVQDVFGAHLDGRCAYLLFYRRVNVSPRTVH